MHGWRAVAAGVDGRRLAGDQRWSVRSFCLPDSRRADSTMIAAVLRRPGAVEAFLPCLPALARSFAAGRPGPGAGNPPTKPGIPGVQHIVAVASGKVLRRRRRWAWSCCYLSSAAICSAQ